MWIYRIVMKGPPPIQRQHLKRRWPDVYFQALFGMMHN